MTAPLVSIVIPCYNAQAYVGEAITSALEQTYPNKEVIVIDDGSTDGSLEVIRSFGDRIRWETGPNRGGCAARNRGIELARGELIQFLDADDLLHPDKLEKQVPKSLREPNHIVFCDHFVQAMSAVPNRRLCSIEHQFLDPVILVLRHRTMATPAPLHRHAWLTEVGAFRVGLAASQEFDLHLRLAASGRVFSHLPEALFTVRRMTGSVSDDTGRVFSELVKVLPEVVTTLRQRGKLSDARRIEFAAYAVYAGRMSIRHGRTSAGLRLLALAQELDPQTAHSAYSRPSRALRRLFGHVAVERVIRAHRIIMNAVKRYTPRRA